MEKSQLVAGHVLDSLVSTVADVGWQSAMCFLNAGLVGVTVLQEPQEYPRLTFLAFGLLARDLFEINLEFD